MKHKVEIRPMDNKDIKAVSKILSDWLTKEEVDHYTKSIQEIVSDSFSTPKFNSHYYVAIYGEDIVGVAGFRIPNPKLLKFATTKTPAELCMLYVAKEHRGGKSVGTVLLDHILDQVKDKKYTELIVRSAEKFTNTGWGFYDKKGFNRIGQLSPPEAEKVSQIWTKKISITSPNCDISNIISKL